MNHFTFRQDTQQPSKERPPRREAPKNAGKVRRSAGCRVRAAATAIKTVIAALTPIELMRTTGSESIMRKQSRRVTPDTRTILPEVARVMVTASPASLPSSTSDWKRERRKRE